MSKIIAFEYCVHKITDWNQEVNGTKEVGLNKLKLIKLHFFICAIKSSTTNNDLFNTFNNFHALPLGPVESDVYNAINERELHYYVIGKNVFNIEDEYLIPSPDVLDIENRNLIDNSINELRLVNPDIINYSAFQLVELSHLWSSWTSIFNFAKSQGKFSEKIPLDIIRTENKIFSL